MIGSGDPVDLPFTCRKGDEVGFAGDDRPDALSGGGEKPEHESAPMQFHAHGMFAIRLKRDCHSSQNDPAHCDLRGGHGGAEPHPLTDGGDGSREALGDE